MMVTARKRPGNVAVDSRIISIIEETVIDTTIGTSAW